MIVYIIVLSCLAIPIIFLIISIFLRLYFVMRHMDCKSSVCLVGKTALVTGGSQGIGYQIVLGLASRGCKVIIADCHINDSIKDAIFKETNNPNVYLKYVNLASFKSVRQFAKEIYNAEDKLDILINNAGVGLGITLTSEDGNGIAMQVNYYSAFLLTHLLLDLLKKSSSGRIIFTSSLMSFTHRLTESNVAKNGIGKGFEYLAYGISKFCQISASEILAEKLKSLGITSNCFHPYAARTTLFKARYDGDRWYEHIHLFIMSLLAQLLGKTAEEAAQTGIYLACANEVKDITGEFFGELKPVPKPPGANNKNLCKAIWTESERIVKLTPEEKI